MFAVFVLGFSVAVYMLVVTGTIALEFMEREVSIVFPCIRIPPPPHK